jgi:MscS family membrane protein
MIATTMWNWLTDTIFLHNSAMAWAKLFGVLLGSLVIGKVLSFFLERHAKKLDSIPGWLTLEITIRAIHRPIMLMIFALGLKISRRFMVLSQQVERWELADGTIVDAPPAAADGVVVNSFMETTADFGPWWDQAVIITVCISIGWLVYRLVDVVEHVLGRFAARTDTLLDDQLVPLVRKTLRIVVVIIAGLYIAHNAFNANVGALVAGLGLGGLAFALAAKDALANLFGSLMILSDRPFHLGDRITAGGVTGNVEEVGFRSTRVRTLDGHLVTIPNATLANANIENVSERPTLKRVINVTITYDTPPEKVQLAIDILREMLDARKDNFAPENPSRVYFNDFNAESLNIIVYYWFTPAEWWDFLEFNNDFNLELLRRYNEEGIEFAFPTQTLYLKSDGSLQADLAIQQTQPDQSK